jgi:hypothetical protein
MKFYKITLFLSTIIIVLALSEIALTNTNQPTASRTGAPGEQTCRSCHGTNELNSGTGILSIDFNDGDTAYVPGQTYPITVKLEKPSIVRFGFQTVILTDSDNKSAGTITVTNSSETVAYNGTVSGSARRYIAQTGTGSSAASTPGTKSWSFNWTAPETNVGDVSIYASGNCANNNGGSSGDFIHTQKLTIKYKDTTTINNSKDIKLVNTKLNLYPNPATDFIKISLKANSSSIVETKITDLFGKEVYFSSDRILTEDFEKQIQLDEKFAKGVYSCKVTANDKNYFKTFVVN